MRHIRPRFLAIREQLCHRSATIVETFKNEATRISVPESNGVRCNTFCINHQVAIHQCNVAVAYSL